MRWSIMLMGTRRRRGLVLSASILLVAGACSLDTSGLRGDGGRLSMDQRDAAGPSEDRSTVADSETRSDASDGPRDDQFDSAEPTDTAVTDALDASRDDQFDSAQVDTDPTVDSASDDTLSADASADVSADASIEAEPPGVPCSSTGQCAGTAPVCLPDGSCGCSSSSECAKNSNARICDPTTRTCVQCVNTSACAGRGTSWTCDPVAHACVLNGCSGGGFCKNGQVCDLTRQICVDCLSSSDCSGQKCDVSRNICVDCVTSGDCHGSTSSCSARNVCVRACGAGRTCAFGSSVCDTAAQACVECVTNGDCGRTGFCQVDQTCR
jgi:hypothetical protein